MYNYTYVIAANRTVSYSMAGGLYEAACRMQYRKLHKDMKQLGVQFDGSITLRTTAKLYLLITLS